MKIMVMDDERWIRKGILKMIDKESLGINEVYEASSIAEARVIFVENKPEIVISDVRLPIGNGCTFCRELFDMDIGTKFIMLSGNDEFNYAKEALVYHAVDYLLKPVEKSVLNDTIRRACDEWIKEQDSSNVEKQIEITQTNVQTIIKQIISDIDKEYAKKMTLNIISEKYHINEAYLSNQFKKTTKVPLMNYIMQVRVEKAKDLMLMTRCKVNDVAKYVGYEDSRYFARVFKRLTGETPSDFWNRQVKENGTEKE